jgi:hypothetical protein
LLDLLNPEDRSDIFLCNTGFFLNPEDHSL